MKRSILIAGIAMALAVGTNASAKRHYVHAAIQQKWRHPTEAMIEAEVNEILNTMRQKSNDAEKIEVLEAGVKGKGIMVDQLITLLNQFLTDDSKLQCAEFAYPYTVDYKSFAKVDDLFSTEEYKNKLNDFVKKNK